MFAVALMSTSCCKDDPVVPEGLISETELLGMWEFQTFEYAGIPDVTTSTSCDDLDDPELNPVTAGMRSIKMSLNFDELGCDWLDECKGDVLDNDYELNGATNQISLDNGLVWVVLSYDGTYLVLELTENGGSSYVLEDAVYTLKK